MKLEHIDPHFQTVFDPSLVIPSGDDSKKPAVTEQETQPNADVEQKPVEEGRASSVSSILFLAAAIGVAVLMVGYRRGKERENRSISF